MAEQISHNVVENTESTSGSPLVDVAANQTTNDSADYGTNDHALYEKIESPELQSANEHVTNSHATTSDAITAIQPVEPAAEPSAGDASGTATELPTVVAESNVLDNGNTADTPLPNGVHDITTAENAVEDGSFVDGSVDVSLNSDTEGSRGDASEVKKDEKHHTRTNSVKKPTTFSKVSVTKNFLAKSATATPPVAKLGDKPSPAGTPGPQPLVAKPRLIAKTGASLATQKARQGSDSASGPDASKVWNKNRPVPPPPPKQFTDEELKQQYGIHLATRLQTDENGKESKWADIDDDEDDWVPENVVWMDGTKSTLAPHEAIPPPKEQTPASVPSTAPEGPKPSLAVKKITELGPQKTILKPGASAAAAQAKQNGAGSGGLTDKNSSLSNSALSGPAKSPWAKLPPVDKVSPVNPPVQQMQMQMQPPRFVSQDARSYEHSHAPPTPAREIAADTFDRSWREGEGGTRELFNSANGRYEPAPEGRRGSIKTDAASRKPSVLQRPSQSSMSPAEPSAAFQTRTSSQMDGSWGRRRGSSLSQGSLPPGRRMSVSKGPDMSPAPERRTSVASGHDVRMSPTVARNEPAKPTFAQQSAWQQQMPSRPESGSAVVEEEGEDAVKAQERIMREKRELAKKRRQEEEQQLEAEKQERLAARLASLAGAGKSRKEREAEAAAAAGAVTPSTEQPSESTASLSSKVEPAMPVETAGDPALHTSLKQPSPEKLPSPLPSMPATGLPDRPLSENQRQQQARPHLSPRAANTRISLTQQQQQGPYRAPVSSYSSPGERKQQPFGRAAGDNFTPWPTTAPNSSVWGSSGIGNGTFHSSNVFAPILMTQQSSSLPPPPGMSGALPSGSTRVSPQSLAAESRSPSLQQSVAEPPARGFGPPSLDSRPVNGASPAPGLARQAHLPAPIGPPSRAQQQQQPAQRQEQLTWQNAHKLLPYQYSADADAAERRVKDAAPSAPRHDTIKETFKQTSADQGKLGAPRRYQQTEYTVHDAQGSRSVQSLSPAPPSAQTQPSGPFSTASPVPQDPWKAAGDNTVRIPDGSLNPAHGGVGPQQPPIGSRTPQLQASSQYTSGVNHHAGALAPGSDGEDVSPPPPESSSHPVNSGDTTHPLVRLPKEKPKVKLPPASAAAQTSVAHSPMTSQQTILYPHRPISHLGAPGSGRPIVQNEAWQARFNGLFNRTPIHTETPPSPPKTPPKMTGPALAVASSSRAAMDDGPRTMGATVSLPQAKKTTSVEGFTIDDSDEATTKPTIEQMFTEERSFGSLPAIRIPRNPNYNIEVYQANPATALESKTHNALRAVDIGYYSESDVLEAIHVKPSFGYYVHIPAVKLVKRKAYHNSHKANTNSQDRKTSGRFNRPNRNESEVANSGTPNTSATSTPVAEAGKRTSSWAKPPRGPPRSRQVQRGRSDQ